MRAHLEDGGWQGVRHGAPGGVRLPGRMPGPYFKGGIVHGSGCASLRSPHLRAKSLGAVEKWRIRSLDVENASLQSDGLGRVFFLRAPNGMVSLEWLLSSEIKRSGSWSARRVRSVTPFVEEGFLKVRRPVRGKSSATSGLFA